MNLLAAALVPAMVAAQGYNLVITTKDGEEIKIPTEEVSKISFHEGTVDPGEPEIPDSFEPYEAGTRFAYGTTREGGWIDVDKVYNAASAIREGGSDGLMCWACSTSALMQWWNNEYKLAFGSLPEYSYDVPTKSDLYTTPWMDVLVRSFPDDAYDALWAFRWYFVRNSNYPSFTNNEHPTFIQDSPYIYGGIVKRDEAYLQAYVKKYTAWELFPSSDPASKIERTFSDLMLSLLAEGAVEITVNKAIHSVMCWGADYVCDGDGKPTITRIYIGENGGNENVVNGLNRADVSYVTGDVRLSGSFYNLTSMTVVRSPRVVKKP